MNRISAKFLVSIGLTVFVLGIIMLAFQLRIMPDPLESKLAARAATCENIAVNVAIISNSADIQSVNQFLNTSTDRDSSLRSIGMRRADGALVTATLGHEQRWEEPSIYPTETHVTVPILAEDGHAWGNTEFTFTSISQPGLWGFFANPVVRFLSFVIPSAFFIFYFYLGRMLKVMNATSVPQRVRTALNTLAGGLIVMDERGDIVLANESLANWVGKTPDELMGRQIDRLPWQNFDQDQSAWAQALHSLAPVTGQTVKLQSDTGTRTLIVNASPMIGHNGELRGAFVGFEDVTLLEQKEIEHKRLREEAEQANSAKSDFLARMSHEIRTPMNAILGFTDVLRRGFDSTPAERTEYLNTIHSSGEHLLSLINDILDLSKVEAGHLELESKTTSPHRIILETLKVLGGRAQEKGLSLSYEPAEQLPETLEIDPVRLRQIVTNLVGNAIKFTDRGGVQVVASMAGDKFQFSVLDTGIGISPEAQQTIFDPFSQADSSITRKFGGTGLGLAIAKRFAEMMGGGIRVDSEPGKGTAFTVQIDCGEIQSVARITRAAALATISQPITTSVNVELPNCKALIVDDGASNRRLLKLFLSRAGADLEEAENGQEAIDWVNQAEFDVILMDMQMPVMDGYTAATELRRQGCTIPIVALTAHAMASDEAKCLAAGCSHFLSKPVDSNKLLSLLADILGGAMDSPAPPMSSRPEPPRLPTPASPLPAATATEVPFTPPAPATTTLATQQPVSAPLETLTPILSTLPLAEDPEFRELVVEFVDHLHEQLKKMAIAHANQNFGELANLAHWLKGSGGTAGFHEFTVPASALERFAKAEQSAAAETALGEIQQITDRIHIPHADSAAPTAS